MILKKIGPGGRYLFPFEIVINLSWLKVGKKMVQRYPFSVFAAPGGCLGWVNFETLGVLKHQGFSIFKKDEAVHLGRICQA